MLKNVGARCPKGDRIVGPPHSMYGQTDSGICYCVSCAGDVEEAIKAMKAHEAECAICAASGLNCPEDS